MQFNVRRTIPDISACSASYATRFRRLAHREKNHKSRSKASHRKTWAPATCTWSDPNSTTTRSTNPPKRTSTDAVATL